MPNPVELFIPTELWLLVERDSGNPVQADEEMEGIFLAAVSERDAWFAAAYQAREHDIDCVAIRVLPPREAK